MIYKIIFDNGKPYEDKAESEEELKEKLNNFYCLNKDNEDFFDVKVFNNEEDISESQFISEMIADILESE
jgi:hypothetical protein